DLLLVNFRNAVGLFDLPHLGKVEVVSGKWSRADFDRMLADLTEVASGLPFSTAGAALPYDRSVVTQQDVLYHLFTYLRHVLSDPPPREDHLLPALRLIPPEPHRHFDRVRRWRPLDLADRIDAAGLVGIVTGKAPLLRASAGMGERLPLVRTLR